jgi:release factor glutamine methyltransferase
MTISVQSKAQAGGSKKGAPSDSLLLPSSRFDALRHATEALAVTDSPRLTAEVLLAHLLGISRAQLLSRPERPVPANTLAEYEALITRAATGEPLAYLTGHREFCSLDFLVDSRVLVPRPETELLVELALKFTAEIAEDVELNILDVGTGSGCIAVTLAVRLPSARVTALDISADVLALARLNAERHSVAGRITFLQNDLLSDLPLRTSHFALLLANLPYIPTAELRRLPVSTHEPTLALDGGLDGLALIRRLLASAPGVMAPHGRLLLEINDAKGAEIGDLARAAFPAAHVEIHKDFAGLDRAVAITL